jgi:hypothetical protein
MTGILAIREHRHRGVALGERAQLIRQRHTHVVVAPGDDKAGAFSSESESSGAANSCERAGNHDDWGAHL